MRKTLLLLCLEMGVMYAQTVITGNPGDPLNITSRHVFTDTSANISARACLVGDIGFANDATAGQNIYLCTSLNTWTQANASAAATAFSAITGATNTNALIVGTGGTFTFSGTGTINANKINGVTLSSLASGLLFNTTTTGVPSSIGFTAGSSGNVFFNSSGGFGTDSGLSYNSGTKALGVIGSVTTGQTGTGTGSVLFNGLTSGTITLKPNDVAGTATVTIPGATGTLGLVAGTSGQVPFNSGVNTYSADSGLAYNSGTKSLGVIGTISTGQNGTAAGTVNFNGLTSGTVTVKTADAAGTWTFKWPTSGGTNGQALTTDGTGIASWTTVSGASPLTTKGDLFGFSTVNARIPIGTDTNCLIADSTQALGLKWGSCGSGSGTVTTTGTMTSTAFVTSAGTTVIQTPFPTATLDASGNAAFTQVQTGDGTKTGDVAIAGVTSGMVQFTANDVAGSPNPIIWPSATGAANALVQTTGTGQTCPTGVGTTTNCQKYQYATAGNGITLGSGTIAFDSSYGNTLYLQTNPAGAATQTMASGALVEFNPSASKTGLRTIPAATPSTPLAGGINMNVAGNMMWYDGTNWQVPFTFSSATPNAPVPTTLNVPADVVEAVQFCADAGSTDTYACNLSPAIASYVTGTHYRFKANTANTGAASINFNGKGALTIKKAAGGITTDLATNDIRAGQWVDVVYDGTNAQMQSTLGNAAGGSVSNYYTSTVSTGIGPTTFTPTHTLDITDATASTGVTNIVVTEGAGQSSTPLLEFKTAGTTTFARINASGGSFAFTGNGFSDDGVNYTFILRQNELVGGSSFIDKWTNGNVEATVDTGAGRHGAGVVELNNGTAGGNGGLFIAGLTSSNTGDYVCWNAGAFEQNATACAVSSQRFKHNINPLPNVLSKVLAMKPVTFWYNKGYGDNYGDTQPDRPKPTEHMGFVAEDAAKVFPDLVPLDKEGKPASFDYPSYVAALTSAIQEQQRQINQLKGQVRDLQVKISGEINVASKR